MTTKAAMKFVYRLIIASVLACACVGCDAVPDEDTVAEMVDRLRSQVSAMPPSMMNDLNRWGANRVAWGYMVAKGNQRILGHLQCTDDAGRYPIRVAEMLRCLHTNQTMTYSECFRWLAEEWKTNNEIAENGYCYWEIPKEFDPEYMPDEFEADRVTLDHVVEALLGPPPPKEIQLLLLGAGGFFGAGGVLCPLSSWGCPEDPFSGSSGPSSAASGGGDR